MEEGGLYRHVITAVFSDGSVLSVLADGKPGYFCGPQYAADWLFATAREALENAARHDLAYCEPRAEFSQRAIEAIESGGSLGEFWDGYNEVESL